MTEAGDDQRREDLVGRNARRLHRDDLAVLVEAGEGDQRAEQDREGQEARDQQRDAQRDIAPQFGIAIARDGEDLARFAEQVERHQDEHQRDEHREAAREEQPDHVEGEPPRREELQVDHARPRLRQQPADATAPAAREGALERADRLAARLVGEDVVHPEDQRRREEQAAPTARGSARSAPARRRLLGILVDLVIGDDDHDPDEDAERGSASLGRHRERHREQRQHQHHQHFDQPEVEIGLGAEPVRSCGAVAQ